MKKNGFTIVELLTSFVLTMIIMVFLFEVVIELKDVYVQSDVRTKVTNSNALVATTINNVLDDIPITGVECTDKSNCTVVGVKGEKAVIQVENDGKIIVIGDRKIKLPDGTEVNSFKMDSYLNSNSENNHNSYIKIGYKITGANIESDFDFSYIYTFTMVDSNTNVARFYGGKKGNIKTLSSNYVTCKPTDGSNECTVTVPGVTAKDGYSPIGWSTENYEKELTKDDKNSLIAKSTLVISGQDKVYYAYAIDENGPEVTFNNGGSNGYIKEKKDMEVTITDKGSGLAENQIIQYAWSTSNTKEPQSWESGTTIDATYSSGYILTCYNHDDDNCGVVFSTEKLCKAYEYSTSSDSYATCYQFSGYACPSGYTLNSSTKKCYKNAIIIDATEQAAGTCPGQSTLYMGACYYGTEYYSKPLEKTSYTCPSGYTLNGKKCTKSSSNIVTTNSKGAKSTKVTIPMPNNSSTYYLWIKEGISDLKGNMSKTTVSGASRIDNTAPNITFDTATDKTYSNSKTVKVTLSDLQAGLGEDISVSYGWSKSAITEPDDYEKANLNYSAGDKSTSFDAKLSGVNGEYYLWVKPLSLNDALGNINTEKAKTSVFYLDSKVPSMEIKADSDKYPSQIYVQVTDNLSGVANGGKIKYAWSTEYLENTDDYAKLDWKLVSLENDKASIDISNLNGEYYLYVQGVDFKDIAGNENSKIIVSDTSYKFDTSSPKIQIEQSACYKTKGNDIDSSNDSVEDTSDEETTEEDVDGSTEEVCEVYENEAWTNTKTITVNISDVVSENEGSGIKTGSAIKYGWSISNAIEPDEYSTHTIETEGSESNYSFEIDAENLNGEYYLWLIPDNLSDIAGNKTTDKLISSYIYRFDNENPSITASYSVASSTISLVTEASDLYSGVAEYYYKIGEKEDDSKEECTEYDEDGECTSYKDSVAWESSDDSYVFTGLKANTTYSIKIKVVDVAGNETTILKEIKTSILDVPAFEVDDNNITITYPSVCGVDLDCSYIKDGEKIEVEDETQKVTVTMKKSGDLIAIVTDGTNTTSSTYTYKGDPVIKSYNNNSSDDFHNENYKNDIVSATFVNSVDVPDDAIESWDVSDVGDNSVIAWIVPNATDSSKYNLYIGADNEKIIANTNSSYLFYNFTNLEKINFNNNYDTSSVTNMSYMFHGCNSLTNLDLSEFNTSNVTDMSYMFYSCISLGALNLSSFDTSKVINMSYMFHSCNSLTNLDLDKFNTSNVTNMSYMFYGCSSLSSLDLSNFNTSNITSMDYMFAYCSNLNQLKIDKFDTSKVTDMSYTFQGCTNLTNLDLSNFNTSNVTNMDYMFAECESLKSLDLSNFDTSNVTDMSYMFYGCREITDINVSNFDTTKVTNMSGMFYGCLKVVDLDLNSFKTSNLTSVGDVNFTETATIGASMFGDCTSLETIELCNFDTSKITNLNALFRYTPNLKSVYVGPNWTEENATTDYMFDGSGITSVTKSNNCEIEKEEINVSLSTSSTTNSITAVASATADSGIAKYEFSKDGGTTWVDNGTSNAYTFTGLKNQTASNTLKDKVVTSGDGLYADSIESGRYVYKGASPDNYLTLGTDTYRIISVESDGTLKVIKNTSIGSKVFDPGYSTNISGVTDSNSITGTRYSSTSTDYCYASSESKYYGCQSWGSKTTTLDSSGNSLPSSSTLPNTEAYLNTYLNGTWYNTLSSEVQSKITTHLFDVGGISGGLIDQSYVSSLKWKGKIGLMNVTDYVEASSNSSCTRVYAYEETSDCYSDSDTHNWLYIIAKSADSPWTISYGSFNTNIGAYSNVWNVSSNSGALGANLAQGNHGVLPVLYLSSDISLSGSGTSSDSYTVTDLSKSLSTYNIKTRVTSKIGKTAEASKETILKTLEPPTFSESGTKVTITYPEGCGDSLTCSYIKDDGKETKVNKSTISVNFINSGNLVANVSDGTNTVSSSYTYISKITVDGTTIRVVSSGDGLYKDPTEEGRYVYKGLSPNNYIKLGSDTYRIISVESDETLKVITNSSALVKDFDNNSRMSILSTTKYCNSGSGCNVWGSSGTMLDSSGNNVMKIPRETGSSTTYELPDAEAYLNTYLNTGWYKSLSTEVKSKINTHLFNVGSVKLASDQTLATDLSQEKAYKWKGNIGLMNITDYVKASTNTACTGVYAYYNDSSCYSNSYTHNWLTRQSWTITPGSGVSNGEFYVYDNDIFDGLIGADWEEIDKLASPVFFLTSNIRLSGSGTSSDPYTITS